MRAVFLRSLRRWFVTTLAVLLVQSNQHPAYANPTGGTVAQGAATITTAGSQLTIQQTSANAYINWQSFNIPAGETTTFIQPSSASVAWNQINGGNASQILGNLNANGIVILQNPSGFYIGGQATITAHGLVMTTAASATPAPNVFSGGAWQFNTPPPTAKIINYGQINTDGKTGGSVFLIANDIENYGTISAPAGKIGLFAGQQVLVSMSPDGRGLSAKLTLPQGSVDNEGNLIADGGSIIAQAQVVNQNGLIQANSVKTVNGVIELVASDSLTLGTSSDIEVNGDSSASSASPGGFVVLRTDNTFADTAGSKINVSGQIGGQNGIIEVFGNNVVDTSSLQSGIGNNYALLINPNNITLSAAPTDTSSTSPNLNLTGLNHYSQIGLQSLDGNINYTVAAGNLVSSTSWTLADVTTAMNYNLVANSGDIVLNKSIKAGYNWNLNLTTGGSVAVGSSSLQTQNGDITVLAANDVTVGGGAIRTIGGGNISVTATTGSVNTGTDVQGYLFGQSSVPYYMVNAANLGGISTAAGGNVNITAGGDITSYLPGQSDYVNAQYDGGCGAFGPQLGNVTLTAGGNVYGHYVLANGVGTITANGGDVGAPLSILANDLTKGFALSLISGSWTVNAPHGSIYVQDVRNPNGIFGETFNGSTFYAGYHIFDYAATASVELDAGNSVEITGYDAPHYPKSTGGTDSGIFIPILFPPSLTVNANNADGAGGFILDTSVILFPSPNQDLNITTLNGGNFGPNTTDPYSTGPVTLSMSATAPNAADGKSYQWLSEGGIFTTVEDDTSNPFSLTANLNNLKPVIISIDGSINDVNLYTTKATEITVKGDMINSGLVAVNLHANDVTSIKVTGEIYNSPLYSFAKLNLGSGITSANPLQPTAWDSVFMLALDSSLLASLASVNFRDPANNCLDNKGNVDMTKLADYLKGITSPNIYLLFPSGSATQFGSNPGFVYDSGSGQLGYQGKWGLSASQTATLSGGTLTVLVADSRGIPVIDANGHLETTTYNFGAASTIATLATEGQHASSNFTPGIGYQVGGLGQFTLQAAAYNLGNTVGIVSPGFVNAGFNFTSLQTPTTLLPNGLLPTAAEGGAAITVTTSGPQNAAMKNDNLNAGDLVMNNSAIYSCDGGKVTVNVGGEIDLGTSFSINRALKIPVCYGIYTSGHSDVSVTAAGDINIWTSRIATFNGGDVMVTSSHGNVNVGTGDNIALSVSGVIPSASGPVESNFGVISDNQAAMTADPAFYGSGILAEYPLPKNQSGGKGQPGNITVSAPEGNLYSGLGGISQFALNQSLAGNPTVTLTAASAINYSKNLNDLTVNGVLYPAGTLNGVMVNGAFQPCGYMLNGQFSIKDPDPTVKDQTKLYGFFVNNVFQPEGNIILGGAVVCVNLNLTAPYTTGTFVTQGNADIKTAQQFVGTVLSGGSANFSGGGSVAGTIIGIGGISVGGGSSVAAGANLFSASVSGVAGVQNTLGTSATATAGSQAAAGESSHETKQLASTIPDEDDEKKHKLKPALSRHLKRVTVILPKAI